MDTFKVIVADDDAGIRQIMRLLIEKAEGFAFAGEAEDGAALLKLAEEVRPDVVFLDVEMPGMTGIECARVLQDTDPATVLIFATAHEGYMSEAFELYAFDYLLKPFKVDRMRQTLARVRERLTKLRAAEIAAADAPQRASRPATGRLMLHHREGVSFINYAEILLVQREDRATVLYTTDEKRFVTGDSLGDMEAKLPEGTFFRCHKSYIINLDQISDITPYGRWTYVVRLKGTRHDALITHEKYEELERMFA